MATEAKPRHHTIHRLLTCRECDRIHRKRKGTAAAAYRARMLPGRPYGNRILVSAKRAEELWGAQ